MPCRPHQRQKPVGRSPGPAGGSWPATLPCWFCAARARPGSPRVGASQTPGATGTAPPAARPGMGGEGHRPAVRPGLPPARHLPHAPPLDPPAWPEGEPRASRSQTLGPSASPGRPRLCPWPAHRLGGPQACALPAQPPEPLPPTPWPPTALCSQPPCSSQSPWTGWQRGTQGRVAVCCPLQHRGHRVPGTRRACPALAG